MILKDFSLFIWDFDDTLIDTRAYYIRKMDRDSILKLSDTELIQDIPGTLYFRQLCNDLVSGGKRVAIASFGTYSIIQAYMDRIFGFNQKIFTKNNIKTINRDCKGNIIERLPNKNKFIDELMRFYNLRDTNKVILFDDRIENCADATMMGVVAIKIAGRDENKIITVGKFFDERTIARVESELKGVCEKERLARASKDIAIYDDRRAYNYILNNQRCNNKPSINPINIFPIIDGFNNTSQSISPLGIFNNFKIVLAYILLMCVIAGILVIQFKK
jgi:hypothetical protein